MKTHTGTNAATKSFLGDKTTNGLRFGFAKGFPSGISLGARVAVAGSKVKGKIAIQVDAILFQTLVVCSLADFSHVGASAFVVVL